MSPLLDLEPAATLIAVKRTDVECRLLADRHYSRQTPGAREFMGNGRTLVLRDVDGTVVFGWLYPKHGLHVIDACWCSIFRNEGPQLSSALVEGSREPCPAALAQPAAFRHVHRPAQGSEQEPRLLLQGGRIPSRRYQHTRLTPFGKGIHDHQGGTPMTRDTRKPVRQGDVLFVPVADIPAEARQRALIRNCGRSASRERGRKR